MALDLEFVDELDPLRVVAAHAAVEFPPRIADRRLEPCTVAQQGDRTGAAQRDQRLYPWQGHATRLVCRPFGECHGFPGWSPAWAGARPERRQHRQLLQRMHGQQRITDII